MNCDFILNDQQQALVEHNLLVIDKVISRYINVNEGVCGLGRDDLNQEGALALCKAAASYDGTSAKFSTYATSVVRNHLFSYCKAVSAGQRKLVSISFGTNCPEDDRPPPIPKPSVPDAAEHLIAELDTADLLADYKRRFSGVARLGVEALELRTMGLSGSDVARLYGVKPNQVGAWVARATKKSEKMWRQVLKNGCQSCKRSYAR